MLQCLLISNFSVISHKCHVTMNQLFNPFQSTYHKFYSTETVLLSLHDYLISATGRFCLLDFSAAFDTIDYAILLNRSSLWFRIWYCTKVVQILSFSSSILVIDSWIQHFQFLYHTGSIRVLETSAGSNHGVLAVARDGSLHVPQRYTL